MHCSSRLFLGALLMTSFACGNTPSDTEDGSSGGTGGTGAETGGDTGTPTGDTGAPTTGDSAETGGTSGGVDLPEGCDALVSPGGDDTETLQAALLDAADDSTVCLAEGTFMLNTEISISADGLTLKGAGRGKSILDFSDQDLGANGIKITGDDVTVTAFTVQESPGDGIRGDMVKNITFDDVEVVWAAPESMESGAYGFYPVGCDGVVIRNSLVRGARDAGIYVGQSYNIIVEDNEAYGNVAGIEIENSYDATVRRNHAHDNTGGILIFNLPGLEVKNGTRTLAYDNIIENNNGNNFGIEGTAVAAVPPGLGFMILASDGNELRNNTIRGNKSTGIVITQYTELLLEPFDDPEYDVFAEGNYIHDNVFENNATDPDVVILTITEQANPGYDMLLDGCIDAMKDNSDGSFSNCFNGNGSGTFLDFQLCNNFMMQSADIAAVTCDHTPLMAP
jgi:parallel beta-helix repeat protein